ncbi:MAG: metallophosphoesterase [Deltaproteobacteria bacterium]|jgi:predicted MPP superfamily phosphohydrolase|nr:metallophosphoesterase [Deltaproteobacteria bacterium]
MFVSFGVLLTIGVFFGFITFLPFSWPTRAGLTAAAAIFASRVAILRYVFGGVGGIEAPKGLLYATSFFQGAVALLFLFGLFRLVAMGLTALLAFLPSPLGQFFELFKKGLGLPKVSLGLLVVALLASGVSLWQAAKVPVLKKSEVVINSWPKGLDGLTMAILADAHISRFFDRPWVEEVVDLTMAQKPDLILLPGDVVDGSVEQRAEDVAPLARLSAPYGVFAIVGNHEYYSGLMEWLPAFERLGFKTLYNSHALVFPFGVPLILAGVTDLTALDSRFNLPGPDLAKALEGAPKAPVVLMEHRPSRARQNAKDPRVTIQISGHTHGGMLPGLKALVAKVNDGFVVGWYDVGDLKLFVHPGLGLWNGFPMRLFDPSEITIVTVRAA